MKRLAMKLAVLTAATMISALPVLAEEGANGMGMSPGEQQQKDECLLVSKNCGDNVDTLQQRIDRLSREIGKGSSVYTPQELRRLDMQLQDNIQMLENLMRGGA